MNEAPPLVTAIVPTWNEEPTLGGCLRSLLALDERPEVIVSDGGSDDGTLDVASSFGTVRIVHASRRQRATQMNDAALLARGQILWFVHADSVVAEGSVRAMLAALEPARAVGGSFRFAVDSPAWRYRWLASMVRFRTRRLRAPYGDQGLFVRRRVFEDLGGFPDQPILEDLHFVRAMRKVGRLAALDVPLLTSPRRWDSRGFLATTIRHMRILALDRLGVSPSRIHERVRR